MRGDSMTELPLRWQERVEAPERRVEAIAHKLQEEPATRHDYEFDAPLASSQQVCGHVDEIECESKHPEPPDPPAASGERTCGMKWLADLAAASLGIVPETPAGPSEHSWPSCQNAECVQHAAHWHALEFFDPNPQRGETITLHREKIGYNWRQCLMLVPCVVAEHRTAHFDLPEKGDSSGVRDRRERGSGDCPQVVRPEGRSRDDDGLRARAWLGSSKGLRERAGRDNGITVSPEAGRPATRAEETESTGSAAQERSGDRLVDRTGTDPVYVPGNIPDAGSSPAHRSDVEASTAGRAGLPASHLPEAQPGERCGTCGHAERAPWHHYMMPTEFIQYHAFVPPVSAAPSGEAKPTNEEIDYLRERNRQMQNMYPPERPAPETCEKGHAYDSQEHYDNCEAHAKNCEHPKPASPAPASKAEEGEGE